MRPRTAEGMHSFPVFSKSQNASGIFAHGMLRQRTHLLVVSGYALEGTRLAFAGMTNQ